MQTKAQSNKARYEKSCSVLEANLTVTPRGWHWKDVRIAVNPAQRLVDVQSVIGQAYGLGFPDEIARLVKPNGNVITGLFDLPFEDCEGDDIFNIVFDILGDYEQMPAACVSVEFRLPSGQSKEVVVSIETRLRDVQCFLTHVVGG
eukprot:8180611-Karenia_brevis.AAC.2